MVEKLSEAQLDAVVAILTSNPLALTSVMDGEPADLLRELLRSIGGANTTMAQSSAASSDTQIFGAGRARHR